MMLLTMNKMACVLDAGGGGKGAKGGAMVKVISEATSH